jgi:Carboxypeptidase regulatory-like domain
MLLLSLGVAACGGSGVTAPTAVRSQSPATPSSAPYMRGTVSDTAFRYIAGATIEIVNGPSAGNTTTSDASGQWGFQGTFDDSTEFRATKVGYEGSTKPLGPFCAQCVPNRWVNFALKAQVTPANIAGSYAMTVSVDPACTSFPKEVRARTYAVTLPSEVTNAYFSIFPTGANFVPGWNQFDGGVSGNYVGFWFETLVEEVAPGKYFMIGVSASVPAVPQNPATITMRADGRISYCAVDAAAGAVEACIRGGAANTNCNSQQHMIVLTRQ